MSQEERQDEEKNKEEVSTVSWQPILGSLWWKGTQRVGSRVVEVVRPRMVEMEPPGTGGGMAKMKRMGTERKIEGAGCG